VRKDSDGSINLKKDNKHPSRFLGGEQRIIKVPSDRKREYSNSKLGKWVKKEEPGYTVKGESHRCNSEGENANG